MAAAISPENKERVAELSEILKNSHDFVITTYSGLNVVEMGELRNAVRQKNGRVKVVKNNLFRIALQNSGAHSPIAAGLTDNLKGPIAVTFSATDLPAVTKALVDFSKKVAKVQVISGCLDGKILAKSEVTQIANLPTREELLTIIARGLNSPATKIAIGMKEIIAGLARGIKAVGEKNG